MGKVQKGRKGLKSYRGLWAERSEFLLGRFRAVRQMVLDIRSSVGLFVLALEFSEVMGTVFAERQEGCYEEEWTGGWTAWGQEKHYAQLTTPSTSAPAPHSP